MHTIEKPGVDHFVQNQACARIHDSFYRGALRAIFFARLVRGDSTAGTGRGVRRGRADEGVFAGFASSTTSAASDAQFGMAVVLMVFDVVIIIVVIIIVVVLLLMSFLSTTSS